MNYTTHTEDAAEASKIQTHNTTAIETMTAEAPTAPGRTYRDVQASRRTRRMLIALLAALAIFAGCTGGGQEQAGSIGSGAGGDSAASPMPTPTRAIKRALKLRATPHRQVMRLQKNTPAVITHLRLPRSARRAIGRPRKI